MLCAWCAIAQRVEREGTGVSLLDQLPATARHEASYGGCPAQVVGQVQALEGAFKRSAVHNGKPLGMPETMMAGSSTSRPVHE